MQVHSDGSYSTRHLINKSHLEHYPQETAAAGKGTFDIKEMWNFMEFEEGRSNISYSNTILARAGHVFNRHIHFIALHGCLPISGFSGDKCGTSRAKMKRNVN